MRQTSKLFAPSALLISALMLFSSCPKTPDGTDTPDNFPAWENGAISGLSLSPTRSTIAPGEAVFIDHNFHGQGVVQRGLSWAVSPTEAGSVDGQGWFLSSKTFSGSATIQANSAIALGVTANCTVNVSAAPSLIHVAAGASGPGNGSPASPFPSIAAALSASASLTGGCTIKVASGVYTENLVLPGRPLNILGGYDSGFNSRSGLSDSVLEAAVTGNPVISMDSWHEGEDLFICIDGFTLRGGLHGILIEGGSPVLVATDCRFTDNGVLTSQRENFGGGINFEGRRLILAGNVFDGNRGGYAGALSVSASATFRIQGNLFEGNSGGADHCGAVYLSSPSGLFHGNVLRDNQANLLTDYGWAGALLVASSGESSSSAAGRVELFGNSYYGNSAKDSGGAVFIDEGANVRMYNELIYGNSCVSGNGGGVLVDGPRGDGGCITLISHCTITGNGTEGGAGNGVHLQEDAEVWVRNSIIWGNAGSQTRVDGPRSSLYMEYSDCPDAGNDMINADPLFADPDNLDPSLADFHLRSTAGRWDPLGLTWIADDVSSPCIDAGNPDCQVSWETGWGKDRANQGRWGNTPEASRAP